MSTPTDSPSISIHDILMPRQMEPVMTAATSDGVFAFETLPFDDPIMGWSKVVWVVTRLREGEYIVRESWGSTTASGLSFTEDELMRDHSEFTTLDDALRHVYSGRKELVAEIGRTLDRKMGDDTP